ncbi:hypothetical protein PIB30_102919 [Stylosanthes scabra]|uniref:Uncharacterized protein n=1 Tax=Stylosanthes scabra TaxID=79078 RepID=A0ABU6UWW2_9FABA|nr:hypothetical protein [Stylosanthes scabra]
MGSGVIYYEIKKRVKYEDFDGRADSDLAIGKTRRYHFDDEPFIHPLHIVRFNPDRPYKLPIESLLALRRGDPLKGKDPSPQRSSPSRRASPTLQYSPLNPIREGNKVEDKKTNVSTSSRVDEAKGIEEENKNEEEEDEEEEDPEEDPYEEEVPAIPRPMDMNADEDYLQYLEEL